MATCPLPVRLFATGVLMLTAASAAALSASEVFRTAAPSVLPLMVSDAAGNALGVQTAVVVGPGRLVTVCDRILASDRFHLLIEGNRLPASLAQRKHRSNLCLLTAEGLALPALRPAEATPAVGHRVFALGNSHGFGVGISEGLVGGLRELSRGRFIQFSAPVTPGSEGGALLDEDGRLIGIVDYRLHDSQNLNLARPTTEIAELDTVAEDEQAGIRYAEEATQAVRAGDWARLAQLSRRRVSQDPRDGEAWAHLIIASEQLKDGAALESACRSLLALRPESAWPGLMLARHWLLGGKLGEALAFARSLQTNHGNDASVWAMIGAAEAANRALDRAQEALNRALTIDPGLDAAHRGMIALADLRRDWSAAANLTGRLAFRSPADRALRSQYLHYLLLAGETPRAQRFLDSLAVDEQDHPATLYWRGRVLLAAGRPLAATASLRQSLDKGIDTPADAWGALGFALTELHSFPEAIAAFREALRGAPSTIEWERGLTVALKDGGHASEAVALAQSRVGKNPDDATAWRHLGFALATQDEAEKAIAALKRSLEIDPRQGKVWEVLIEQYSILGRGEDLRRAYQKLRDVDGPRADSAYRGFILPYEGGAR
ncbi:MAG: trypsin-like peptidase domain-containing protein [Azonexus sp.]|nr:trypsin-like peptidase domain-containing protein [Betaproteobacteria bacterium]MBK8917043.1 trypsin-like peptidase domain-containing protein [Betaproteobacteria bacterium]MBP6037314.1 trypsin-like peptidase domain-containing protein [Azonexus sp.]MBP6907826.1 trypsin-like peptidase domain-containing protein [Azonexus sp.]